jgi:hypothetical protein
MKIIYSTNELKSNFLELAGNLSNEESRALIHLEHLDSLNEKLKPFCTAEFSLDKVLLIFHRYACIAYLSAEFIVNAKLYLDGTKQDFILLSMVKDSDPDAVSVVYSNIKALSMHPTFAITIKELISFAEMEDAALKLIDHFRKNAP